MEKPKFNIGDLAYFVRSKINDVYVDCPDCMGKKYLTVIMGDDSRVTIDCAKCSRGFNPPSGQVIEYRFEVSPVVGTIEEVSTTYSHEGDKCFRYRLFCAPGYQYSKYENELFMSRSDADAACPAAKEAHEQLERDRISSKENIRRTWAWNASYHRSQIKMAKRNLEYHTAKLDVAAEKAKEQKNKKKEG